jgi:hypothetical protein
MNANISYSNKEDSMKKQLLMSVLALTMALSFVGCGSDTTTTAEATTSNPEAAEIGAALSSMFGASSSSNQGLLAATAEGDSAGPGSANFDVCSEANGNNPDGINMETNVPAATYGSSKVIEEGFTCDSSAEATSCLTWVMENNVAVCGLTFEIGSNGIYCYENLEEIVDGTFIIGGVSYLCHANVGSNFFIQCVNEETGEALPEPEEAATCDGSTEVVE